MASRPRAAPSTRQLSAEELRAAREMLSQWQLPSVFRKAVDKLARQCCSADWFNSSSLGFLHDAYVLAEFTKYKRVKKVRLSALREQWPDGQIEVPGQRLNVEITMVMAPNRRIGDEYRFEGNFELRHDPVESWVARGKTIPAQLEEGIRRKEEKRYASPTVLLVDLNINAGGIMRAETEAHIAEIKERYAHAFVGIHVLWKEKLL